MFKKRYTKWIPLGNYTHGGTDYITLVKKNLKTGMLKFITKKVNSNISIYSKTKPILPINLIDISKAWSKINKKQ